jgi:hypothetical protein
VGVAKVTLSRARVTGGSSTEITVRLTQPAPEGGIDVHLTSSDASVVTTPATVRIPSGESSATVQASTSPVNAAATVGIAALYADTAAGASLTIATATSSPFTVTVQPTTVTMARGESRYSKVTTKITTGYNHSLKISVANLPTGVTATLTPTVIPAPGAGTSTAKIAASNSAATQTHPVRVTASDGTTSQSATLTVIVVAEDPHATFQGCWQKQNGHRYQAARISVANPGTYPFDANLYYGTTCNRNTQADEFGFGTPLNFGGFDWIFWFSDFSDQSNTSALWHVGIDTSQCVNYSVAPAC